MTKPTLADYVMRFEDDSPAPRIEDVQQHFDEIGSFDYGSYDVKSAKAPPGVVQHVWDRWGTTQKQQFLNTQKWANSENQIAVDYINRFAARPITLTEYGVWSNTGQVPSGITAEQIHAGLGSMAQERRGGGGGLMGAIGGALKSVSENVIAPIGRTVEANPALLFAAPFAVAAISSAVTGAAMFGGSAAGAGAGAGAVPASAIITPTQLTAATPVITGGGLSTAGALSAGAGAAGVGVGAGGGSAALETISLPASATPIAAPAAASTPVLETIVPNAQRLPVPPSGNGGLLSRIINNPIAGRIIEGVGGAIAADAALDAQTDAERELMRERQGLITANYRGADPGAPAVVARGRSGMMAADRFDPSYYDNFEFRYDPKAGRIVEVERGTR